MLDARNTFGKAFFFLQKFKFIHRCNDSREDIMKEAYLIAMDHGNIVTRVVG